MQRHCSSGSACSPSGQERNEGCKNIGEVSISGVEWKRNERSGSQ